jgi:hypothetical protein
MKLALFLAALPLFAQSNAIQLCDQQSTRHCLTLAAPATLPLNPSPVILSGNSGALLVGMASTDLSVLSGAIVSRDSLISVSADTNAYVASFHANSGGFVDFSSGKTGTVTAPGPFRWFINPNEMMRLTTTGLGVGTTAPADMIHAYKNQGAVTAIIVDNDSGVAGVGEGIHFNYGVLGTIGAIEHVYDGGSWKIALKVWDGAAPAEYMSIRGGSGYVGLGTTAPSVRLQLGDYNEQNVLSITGYVTTDMAPALSMYRNGVSGAVWTQAVDTSGKFLISHSAAFTDSSLSSAAVISIDPGTLTVGMSGALSVTGVISGATQIYTAYGFYAGDRTNPSIEYVLYGTGNVMSLYRSDFGNVLSWDSSGNATAGGNIGFAANQVYSVGDSTNRAYAVNAANLIAYSAVLPNASGSATLGSSPQRFSKLWVTDIDFNGTCTGCAGPSGGTSPIVYAGSGNPITCPTCLTTAGGQSIGGTDTFTSVLKVTGQLQIATTSTTNPGLYVQTTNGASTTTGIDAFTLLDSSSSRVFGIIASSDTSAPNTVATWDIAPIGSSATKSLGNNTHRWLKMWGQDVDLSGGISASGSISLNQSVSGAVTLGNTEWQPLTTNYISLGDASHTFGIGYFNSINIGACVGAGCGVDTITFSSPLTGGTVTGGGSTTAGCPTCLTTAGSQTITNSDTFTGGIVVTPGSYGVTIGGNAWTPNVTDQVVLGTSSFRFSWLYSGGVSSDYLTANNWVSTPSVKTTLIDNSGNSTLFKILGGFATTGIISLEAGNVAGLSSVIAKGRNNSSVTTQAFIIDDVGGGAGAGITLRAGGSFVGSWQGGTGAAFDVINSSSARVFTILPTGHIWSVGSTPSVPSGCTSSGSVSGTDSKGVITCTNVTSGTAVVMNFASSYASAPVCIAHFWCAACGGSGSGIEADITSVSTSSVSFRQGTYTGQPMTITYICVQ